MTEYEYDEGGRLIRSVTVGEGEWTELDRAEMFALALFRDGILCPCGCGFMAADTFANEKLGPVPQFSASRIVCRARLARLEAEAALEEQGKSQSVSARARVWTTSMRKG